MSGREWHNLNGNEEAIDRKITVRAILCLIGDQKIKDHQEYNSAGKRILE